MGSTEDLGDMETWLMPALIPLGSCIVGRVPGRPGRPARTHTQRPRTHICMLARQDIHATQYLAQCSRGCKMGRCGSAARQKTQVCHDGNHSTTIIRSQTDCKCIHSSHRRLCTCVSLGRRLAPTTCDNTNRRPPCSKAHNDTHTLVFYRHFEAVQCIRVLLTCRRRCSRRRRRCRHEEKRKNSVCEDSAK